MKSWNQIRPSSFALLLLASCAGTSPAPAPAPPAPAPAEAASDAPPATDGAATSPAPDWAAHFGAQEGCFVMLSTPGDTWVMNDPERCKQGFRPFSTFKIVNALIGLETGAVAGADTVIEWDPEVYPAEDWWPPSWRERNDLRAAFHRSALPYFRAMATRIGEAAMGRHMEALGYGNRDMSGGLDLFWLTGALRVSAVEQIRFLRALNEGRLPVSERSQTVLKDIMVRTRGDDYVVRAKTGTGTSAAGPKLAWFVGYVERGDKVHYFALNRSGREYSDIPRKQTIAMTENMLAELGALPGRKAD